ncbi:MAG: NAD(P)/FAD-dependent oxidoreductase [Oscillospiraceae bacterium]|nr:NAD(P)/FAD-dependent oxidoreductase [Oscillospiraceae bacterium]
MEYDVIVVGACTAGTYFSGLLGKAGLKVLVIDKDSEENLCKRLDIVHFTRDSYAQFGVEPSKEGDPEFVRNFEICYSKSALNNHLKENAISVAVLHLPLFIRRLRETSQKHGVEFRFGAAFDALLYDDRKRICGIALTSGEEIRSRLVVDASGISAVVRRSVDDPYMENFETGPRDKFYVLLKYVELLDPNIKIEYSTGWPYYKGWIAPQHHAGGAIIGVGANLSFDYARKCMARFESSIPLPDYRLQYEEAACTPYRRPPLSFVTDGFLAIGDAACLTKPINGEGIPSAWVHCTPAAQVVVDALKDGKYPTKESLWPINTIYQRSEGAAYASERAMLIGAVDMSPEDNDFMFSKGIVFRSDDEPEVENLPAELLKGVLQGKFSIHAFISLMRSTLKGIALEKHYRKYPQTPEGYEVWKKKALKLWDKAGSMADTVKDA